MSFDLSPEFASLASLYEKMGEELGAAFVFAESSARESIAQAQREIDDLRRQMRVDTPRTSQTPIPNGTIPAQTATTTASAASQGLAGAHDEVCLPSSRARTISHMNDRNRLRRPRTRNIPFLPSREPRSHPLYPRRLPLPQQR